MTSFFKADDFGSQLGVKLKGEHAEELTKVCCSRNESGAIPLTYIL